MKAWTGEGTQGGEGGGGGGGGGGRQPNSPEMFECVWSFSGVGASRADVGCRPAVLGQSLNMSLKS